MEGQLNYILVPYASPIYATSFFSIVDALHAYFVETIE